MKGKPGGAGSFGPDQEGRVLDSSSHRSCVASVAVGLLAFALGGAVASAQEPGAVGRPGTPTAVRLGTSRPGGAAPSLPALPDTAPPPASAGAGDPASAPGFPLIAGQVVQPIDLANALRLAGARDLDIAAARQQVLRAMGELDQARGLWLPSLFTGPTYYRLDGQVQEINGKILTVDRGSLFLGTTASLANSFPAAPPGSGFPPLNSLSGVLRISDAIYRGADREAVDRRQQGRGRGRDQRRAALAASEAYFDLQQAAGTLAIAARPPATPRYWPGITASLRPLRCGPGGRPPPHPDRAPQPPAIHPARRRAARSRLGQPGPPALARPARRGRPGEPAETVYPARRRRRPARRPDRPGLAVPPRAGAGRELVEAAVLRLKQAKLRPFVPSLAASYSGGGFGGGSGSFFGNFSTRGDFAASLFWDLRGLGLIDRGLIRQAQAEPAHGGHRPGPGPRPRSPTTSSPPTRPALAASEAMDDARESVAEALQSLELNLTNIRGGARPARRDPAHRGPPADPGAGPGAGRLSPRRAVL